MTKKLFARILILSGLSLLVVLFAWEAFSEELSVVEVRRNVPLSDEEPVYQDYYINSGTNDGLKVNLVVSAVRKISVRDASGTQTYGDMLVPVGQLKVIYAGEKFAVAREVKLFSRDDQPMLEQIGIMIGDKIDTKGAFTDTHKMSGRKPPKLKEASHATSEVAPAVAAATTPAPVAPAPAQAALKPEIKSEPKSDPKEIRAEAKADMKDETTSLDKSEEPSQEPATASVANEEAAG
jgi:hypothetical protein